MTQTRHERIKQAVKVHVGADGPVSFVSILIYVQTQVSADVLSWEVAPILTNLIRCHVVSLYDDGESFV